MFVVYRFYAGREPTLVAKSERERDSYPVLPLNQLGWLHQHPRLKYRK